MSIKHHPKLEVLMENLLAAFLSDPPISEHLRETLCAVEDHSDNEHRFVTIGMSVNKQILVVAHTEDDNTIRVISA